MPRWDQGDVTSKIRQVVAKNEPGPSVLFEYARRPTDPGAMRPKTASGTLILESPPARSKQGLKRALALQAIPTWDDATVPDTGRPCAPSSDPGDPLLQLGSGLTGTLTVVKGRRAGRVVSLLPEQTLLGRSPQADVHLMEDGVSRQHARICWVGSAFVLEDLGSRNGTFVGGQAVDTLELKQGDVIRLGPTATVRFCWMDPHQKSLLEELYETSVRDALTGAYNRRHFAECLHTEIAYACRHETDLSLLLLDIDHFKQINDQHGHPEGDLALTSLASVCQQHLRVEDVFARYGGEEFAALLRGVPLEGAARAAERLRIAIGERVVVGNPPCPVTVSIGCAGLDCVEDPTVGALVKVADQRLYEAKRTGRNRVVSAGYFRGSDTAPDEPLW